jgi:hypothetical protein
MKGKKDDSDKLPIGRILQQFPRALEAIAKCSQYGHNKYELNDDWQNFRNLDDAYNRLNDAEFRHHLARCKGEIIDPESGLPHEYHELWNKIAKLEIKLTNKPVNKQQYDEESTNYTY